MSDSTGITEGQRDSGIDDVELRRRLSKTWGTSRNLWGVLTTVDHKIIGRRYIVTAFFFLGLGGVAAMLMRIQLAQPEAKFVSPDLYNQLFTMHGTTMMFLFAVPVMEAFAVYLVPLMVGTRNIAFPRLNAYSYYVYLFGGLMIWVAFALNVGADTGRLEPDPSLRSATRRPRNVGPRRHGLCHRSIGAGCRLDIAIVQGRRACTQETRGPSCRLKHPS